MDKKEIGKIIRNARKNNKMTQAELARITNFTKRAVQFWEAGERDITLEHADILFKALNITVEVGK